MYIRLIIVGKSCFPATLLKNLNGGRNNVDIWLGGSPVPLFFTNGDINAHVFKFQHFLKPVAILLRFYWSRPQENSPIFWNFFDQ